MAELCTSPAGGGVRSSRDSRRASIFQTSSFGGPRLPSNDAERLQCLQAEADVESCMESCHVMATQCGRMLCLGKMSLLTRVLVLWFWIFVATVLASLITALAVFGPAVYAVSPTDCLLVTRKLSSVFCDGVSLETTPSSSGLGSFKAYLLDKEPDVDQQSRQIYRTDTPVFLDTKEKKHWMFYLLPGSVVEVRACSDAGMLDFFVIKGRRNLDAWESDVHCEDCYIDHKIMTASCSDHSKYDSYTLRVNASGDYILAFVNPFRATWSEVKLKVNRTLYDDSYAVSSCDPGSGSCYLPLTLGYPNYVLFHAGEDWGQGRQLVSRCHPRAIAYVDVFLLGALILGLALSVLVCRCAKSPRAADFQIVPRRRNWGLYRRRQAGIHPTERSPLLGERRSDPVSLTQPPKYDDVMTNGCTPPPSYGDVTGAVAEPRSGLPSIVVTKAPETPRESEDAAIIPIVVLP